MMKYFKTKLSHLLNFCFFFLCMALLSCNTAETNETAVTEKSNTTEPKKTDASSKELKQNGDYSQLFREELKNCDFLTVSELAAILNVAENEISTMDNGYSCTYIYTDDKGLVTRFIITSIPIKKADMDKEIKGAFKSAETLGKDNRLIEVRESETGDTYLVMSQDRNVKLLNSNYEVFTNIGYRPAFDANEKDVEYIEAKREEMRNKAFAIANALLKKYKK